MGHSFGGYNVRVFNGQYPNEVAGLVLADSTQEDQYELLPSAWRQLGASQLTSWQSQIAVQTQECLAWFFPLCAPSLSRS